jgi:TRAP-type C4-dicarboxylate transport system permease small subunit
METQSALRRVNRPDRVINRLDKYVANIANWLNWVAGAGLIAMLVLVVADIVGIKALASPVPGAIEVVAFLGVIVIGFAIAYTQVLHGHIRVDLIVMRLPPRVRVIIDILMIILGIAFFIFLAWRSLDYGQVLHASGEVSMTQRIPFYPFIYALAFCYLATIFVLCMELCKAILKVGKVWIR